MGEEGFSCEDTEQEAGASVLLLSVGALGSRALV